MARTKASSNLLNLVESDSEDDLGGGAAAAAAAAAAATAATRKKTSIRDMPAAKKGRQATAAAPKASSTASKVTKPAQKKESAAVVRRRAAAAAAAVAADETAETVATSEAKTATARGRQILAERTNELPAETTAPAKAKARGRPGRKAAATAVEDKEEEAEEAEEEEEKTTAKTRVRGRPKAGATAAAKDESEGKEAAPRAGRRRAAAATTKKGGVPAAVEDESMAQDETEANEDDGDGDTQQPDVTETQLADSMDVDEKDDDATTATATATAAAAAAAVAAAAAGFQSPVRGSRPMQRPSSALRGRGVAVSSETAGDAAARRRLGDLTKKQETLEARFRDLRDVGVKEAERNFDRLKKQGDDRARVSDELIASLRTELASYRDLAKEGARAKREWDACEARAADLQARVDQLTAALGDAKAEARALTTKLAAARTTAAEGAAAGVVGGLSAVPGSAMKKMGGHGGHGGTAADRAAAAAAAAASQVVQLKENLYGDLTGLLVYSARRDGARELYDCIQTGRSGSLHFKLCLDNDSSARDDDGDGDAQFVYMPQLDASRDADLIRRLPDYLVEEISFPRAQAAKFYSRVVQSLMAEK